MASFLVLSSLGLDRSFDPKPGNPWILVKPIRTSPGAFLAGAFFPRKARLWIFGLHLGYFRIFLNSKKTRNFTKPGYPKYEPVMFDMDPFGGKKVPCTKYQESGIKLAPDGRPFSEMYLPGVATNQA